VVAPVLNVFAGQLEVPLRSALALVPVPFVEQYAAPAAEYSRAGLTVGKRRSAVVAKSAGRTRDVDRAVVVVPRGGGDAAAGSSLGVTALLARHARVRGTRRQHVGIASVPATAFPPPAPQNSQELSSDPSV